MAGLLNEVALEWEKRITNPFQNLIGVHIEVGSVGDNTEITLPAC